MNRVNVIGSANEKHRKLHVKENAMYSVLIQPLQVIDNDDLPGFPMFVFFNFIFVTLALGQSYV